MTRRPSPKPTEPSVVEVEAHPLLDVALVEVRWPSPIGALRTPPWLDVLTALEAPVPFPPPTRAEVDAVRALLRWGGFSPSGRSKPCSEYIRAAAAEGRFPRINPPVDLTNAAALHGAIPVSTVDADRLAGALRVGLAAADARYVFNLSGQEIALGGLLCLHDAAGPAANGVKDAQRAKTTPDTTLTLTVFWGTTALEGRARAVADWFSAQAEALGGAPARIATNRS
jgi:hypothetical protein